ncbi:MAG: 3-dehydroquinate synthase, partial [Thermoflexales bacterium]|nr:3-dehydroquinate synthase [Thermoflexales bacterium]
APTTLLAMTDSSVGGKTGVDLPQGKNLVGAFKQPAVVIMDPQVLSTLPLVEFRAGMAEVIKHAVIGEPGLFAELEALAPQSPRTLPAVLLARSLKVKIAIVEEDPYEQGRRAALNLGHTAGHALERLSDYSLRHGEAVGLGLLVAARLAAELGWADRSLLERLEALLAAWGLPLVPLPFPPEAVWEAMAHDKKRRGRALRWVLPRAVGQVEITDTVPQDLVIRVLSPRPSRGDAEGGLLRPEVGGGEGSCSLSPLGRGLG